MSQTITIVVVVVFAFLFIRLISAPMRLLFKLLINTGCGFVSLFLLNMLSGVTGIVFDLNFASSAIVGLLGLPGVALLLVSKLFL